MSLPAPRLDDRTFDDLVAEAKQRIAARCPAWTDFNASDPGIALIELMAWLTEMTLYRLNRVPELHYVKLLELMGVRLQPARPAKAWVLFEVEPGTARSEDTLQVVPAGTRLSTKPERGQAPLPFVTIENLSLTTARIVATAARYPADIVGSQRDQIFSAAGSAAAPATLFEGGDRVYHHLYLGDPAVRQFGARDLRVSVDLERPASEPAWLEWEGWDGDSWQLLVPAEDGTRGLTQSGGVVFRGLPRLGESILTKLTPPLQLPPPTEGQPADAKAIWIRASFHGSASEQLPIFRTIRYHTALAECSIQPRRAFVGVPPQPPAADRRTSPPPGPLLLPLEFNQEFQPFGPRLAEGSSFYVESELLQKHGAVIQIELCLRTPVTAPATDEELLIHWEYRSAGGVWQELGVVNSSHVVQSKFNMKDGTFAFTRRQGRIEFTCPGDLERAQLQVDAEPGWFVRARIERLAYHHPEKLQASVERIGLGFNEIPAVSTPPLAEGKPWAICLSENHAKVQRHPALAPFQPFVIDNTEDPAFYIGLDRCPSTSRQDYRLFLDIIPPAPSPSPAGTVWDYDAASEGTSEISMSDLKDVRGLIWRILKAPDAISAHLRGRLSTAIREALAKSDASVEALATILIPALNEILGGDAFPEAAKFHGIPLSSNTRLLLSQNPAGNERRRLNRLLLADAYPGEVEAISGWNWRPAGPKFPTNSARIVWEYSAGPETWNPLAVKDGTDSFTREGMVEFNSPGKQWRQANLFNADAFWLRARWTAGGFAQPVKLKSVRLNAVVAEQFERHERLIGTSDGTRNQSFSLQQEILDYPEVWISRDSALPVPGNVPARTTSDGKQWERWTEVRNNFRNSLITDTHSPVRHFTADLTTATIRFGDGILGSIPPKGAGIMVAYRITTGTPGNVGPDSITVLDDPIPGVRTVRNLHPASGGADREDIESAKARGPWEMKHRDRAVTAEDFEQLAAKASNLVGVTQCLVKDGVVHVVIVPRDNGDKPRPGRHLVESIQAYLDSRRLINTVVQVEGPDYESIDLEMDVGLEPQHGGRFSGIHQTISERLRRLVHPIHSKEDGKGWKMGRPLLLSELRHLLEQIDGVDRVSRIRMRRSEDTSWAATRVVVGARSFPFFGEHLLIRPTTD